MTGKFGLGILKRSDEAVERPRSVLDTVEILEPFAAPGSRAA